MPKYPEEHKPRSQRTNPGSVRSGHSEDPVVYGSSIGHFHSDKIRGDSHSTMRTTHFECYGQYSKRENTNQIMDGVLKLVCKDPHDPVEADPVAEKLKELWCEGDTVGTLLNRYHKHA